MASRVAAALVAASLLAAQCVAPPARADNAMGYRLLAPQDAAQLPRNHGSLGLDVERAQRIADNGLVFDIIRVKQVRRGSAGARAGFHPGDQIIAIDGLVFPNLQAFAAFVGSLPPGRQISVDTIPAGGGPQQAQRVAVTIGDAKASGGLSTGSKVAIGVGAAALFGCYELGCFSHRSGAGNQPQPMPQQPMQQQQMQQPLQQQ